MADKVPGQRYSSSSGKRNLFVGIAILLGVVVVIAVVCLLASSTTSVDDIPDYCKNATNAITINDCERYKSCHPEFDVSSCTEDCPFGYETNTENCVISCKCLHSGILEGDIAVQSEDIPRMLEAYGLADQSDFEVNVFTTNLINRAEGKGNLSWFAWYDLDAGYQQPNGRVQIPIELHKTLAEKGKEIIRTEVIPWFTKNTCIDYIEREESDKRHFISIWNNYRSKGCYANLGLQKKRDRWQMSKKKTSSVSRQFVNLSDKCITLHTIFHELLHSIGLAHEQTRPDRDEYVEIDFEKMRSDGCKYQYKKMTYSKLAALRTPFDYKSNVIYAGIQCAALKYMMRGLTAEGPVLILKKKGDPKYVIKPNKTPTEIDIQEINYAVCPHLLKATQPTYPMWGEWGSWTTSCETSGKEWYTKGGNDKRYTPYYARRRQCMGSVSATVKRERCVGGGHRHYYEQRKVCDCGEVSGWKHFEYSHTLGCVSKWTEWAPYFSNECLYANNKDDECLGYILKKRIHSCGDYYDKMPDKCNIHIKIEDCILDIPKCSGLTDTGEWSFWSMWERCISERKCGKGKRYKTRGCYHTRHGKPVDLCEGNKQESEECDVPRACTANDEWMEWGQWAWCDKDCTTKRWRYTRAGDVSWPWDKKSCTGGSCVGKVVVASFVYKWTNWGFWSLACRPEVCEKTRVRYRKCLAFDGTPTGRLAEQSQQNCGSSKGKLKEEQKCSDIVKCVTTAWADWMDWTKCGSSCSSMHFAKARRVCRRGSRTDTTCEGSKGRNYQDRIFQCSEMDHCKKPVLVTTATTLITTPFTTTTPTPVSTTEKYGGRFSREPFTIQDLDVISSWYLPRGFSSFKNLPLSGDTSGSGYTNFLWQQDGHNHHFSYGGPSGKQIGLKDMTSRMNILPELCLDGDSKHIMGNIDGDLQTDYICWKGQNLAVYFFYGRNSGTPVLLKIKEDCDRLLFLDVNGDRKLDFLCFQKSGFYSTYITNKNGFMCQ